MKLLRLLKFLFTFALFRLRKQPESTTDLSYIRYEIQRTRQERYIEEQCRVSDDPLIQFIAATPIHTQYTTFWKAQQQGLMSIQYNFRYASVHHIALWILLHRLGLRGRINR